MRRPLYPLCTRGHAHFLAAVGLAIPTLTAQTFKRSSPSSGRPAFIIRHESEYFPQSWPPAARARSLSKHAAALAGKWDLGCVNPRTIAHASSGRGLYRARSPRGRKERGRRRRSPRKDLVPSLEGGGEIATRRIIREIWASSTHNHRKGFRGRARSPIQANKIRT